MTVPTDYLSSKPPKWAFILFILFLPFLPNPVDQPDNPVLYIGLIFSSLRSLLRSWFIFFPSRNLLLFPLPTPSTLLSIQPSQSNLVSVISHPHCLKGRVLAPEGGSPGFTVWLPRIQPSLLSPQTLPTSAVVRSLLGPCLSSTTQLSYLGHRAHPQPAQLGQVPQYPELTSNGYFSWFTTVGC